MELREFVKTTLVEIAEGVKEAREDYAKLRGEIPLKSQCKVRFDIALTQMDKEDSSKGLGVILSSVKIGANKTEEQVSSSLTRIQFDVLVKLP